MILRCTRTIIRGGISVNRLYPLITYEFTDKGKDDKFQILDNSRSLVLKESEFFEIISNSLNDYIKIDNKYVYKDLAYKDFSTNFYSEDEKSIEANSRLENSFISIFSNELTINELLYHLKIIGYCDENADILLKAFFNKANKKDIISFVSSIYDEIMKMNDYIIKIIVEELSYYKEPEIENLFIELYMTELIDKKNISDIICKYLNM